MNSLHAVSAFKNNNTYSAIIGVMHDRRVWQSPIRHLLVALYTACCYFWMHLLHADCSLDYFLPYSKLCIENHSSVSILVTAVIAIGHSELLITQPSLECFHVSRMNA